MFTFDAGAALNAYRIDRAEAVLDAATDRHGDDLPAVYACAMTLIREQVAAYRTASSVRQSLWRYAPIMRAMAEHAPEAHDELLLEILDRLDRLT